MTLKQKAFVVSVIVPAVVIWNGLDAYSRHIQGIEPKTGQQRHLFRNKYREFKPAGLKNVFKPWKTIA